MVIMFPSTVFSRRLFRLKELTQFAVRNESNAGGNEGEKRDGSKISSSDNIQKYRRPIKREPGIRRALSIIGDELKNFGKGKVSPEPEIPNNVDIAIIGGGIMGSSIAYWLKQRSPESFSLAVIERDETYAQSSTTLSVGGIRQQFSLPENIEMSLYSADFLRNVKKHLSILDQDPPELSFQHQGYLILASESGVEQMKENNKLQKSLGAKIKLLTPDELQNRFPWLNTEGVALGSYGLENEGWFDPWSLLMAFKKKAISLGAKYINAEVLDFEFKLHKHSPFDTEGEPYKSVNTVLVKSGDYVHDITFSVLIVCGGAHSGELARKLNIGNGPGIMKIPFPVEPRKRYVYMVHSENGPTLDLPLIIDHTGAYCRREGLGGHYIVGRSPLPVKHASQKSQSSDNMCLKSLSTEKSEEPDCKNLDVDYNYFEECVWPLLYQRIPAFEALKVKSAWSGYYDYNTLDQNAIIGRYPYYGNVYFATGFSGHGIQMAPSVGRAMMELIIDGHYVTTDLSRFGCDRLILNEPIFEDGIF